MNNFVKGMLVGVGVGLLIAPMRGQEMRSRVSTRLNDLRGYLPENEQLNDYVHQVSDRVNQTAGNVKDYAQQAASKVRDTASDLSDLTQKTLSDVKDSGQDVLDNTKQTAKLAKKNVETNSTGH